MWGPIPIVCSDSYALFRVPSSFLCLTSDSPSFAPLPILLLLPLAISLLVDGAGPDLNIPDYAPKPVKLMLCSTNTHLILA